MQIFFFWFSERNGSDLNLCAADIMFALWVRLKKLSHPILQGGLAHRSRSEPFRSENQKNRFAYFDETMTWEARKHIGASYFIIILAFYQDSILIWQV